MVIESAFRPAPWLRSAHAQTAFATYGRRMPAVDLAVETIELADGDFLDLSWSRWPRATKAPIVLLLPGINGSPASKYIRGALQQLQARGARGLVLHHRGLLRPNRLAATYHSGRTDDVAAALAHARQCFPVAPLAAIGYSLGGNMLLKYLGERGAATPLACAAAVSVPYDLARCAEAIGRGVARVYQRYLLAGLRQMVKAKFASQRLPITRPDLARLRSLPAFDDAITAPLNGFADAADYYARASCKRYLKAIATPTLAVHARDDPFMTPAVIPGDDELSSRTTLEVAAHGGHVGFVAGRGRPDYWLEQRIPRYLATVVPALAGPAR